MDEDGQIMPENSHFVSRYGRFWSYAGDFVGRYMTSRSSRYDDDLVGPYKTRSSAEAAANILNRTEEGLGR